MAKQKRNRINWLERNLPEGLLVDARWLTRHGYSTSLRSQYVAAGRLEQPARGVYRRPRGSLSWQQVAISLQAVLEYPLLVGGRTALELQGYAHYLARGLKEVHLYGSKPPPRWLHKLPLGVRHLYHNDRRLFRTESLRKAPTHLDLGENKNATGEARHDSWMVQPWGQWDWPLALSTPERAILELLDELPKRESFHQVDMLMQNLSNLSPRRLQKLLADCHSIKVKRLFFFFADKHQHAWLKRLDKRAIDLGEGKRMLVKGGKLDKTYQITVPETFDALR
jgi:Transcriptional regulator, AbiEi antitoxin, Type IV TA system/Transcriptional regulator, AbiEi antitoxin N-terminal domain